MHLHRRVLAGPLSALLAGVVCQAGCQHQQPLRPSEAITAADTTRSHKLDGKQVADVQASLGTSWERQGDLNRAAAAYEEALRRDPSRADAYRGLARIRDQEGRFPESRELYRKALDASPGSADIFCDMGYSLYLQHAYAESEMNLRQALALQPQHSRAHNNLGLVLAFCGRTDDAMAEFARGGCGEAEARLNVAFAQTMQNHLDQARSQYELALAADPHCVAARHGLAELNAASAKLGEPAAVPLKGSPTPAVASLPARPSAPAAPLRLAAAREPAVPEPVVTAPLAASRQEPPTTSEPVRPSAAEQTPLPPVRNDAATRPLSKITLAPPPPPAEDPAMPVAEPAPAPVEKPLACAPDACELQPLNSSAPLSAKCVESAKVAPPSPPTGGPRAEIAMLWEAPAEMPQSAAPRAAGPAHSAPADGDAMAKSLAGVEAQLRQVLALSPDHVQAHRDLGVVLAYTGRSGEALGEFRKSGCSDAEAHLRLAEALAQRGRWTQARQACLEVLVIDPGSSGAKQLLAQADAALGTSTPPGMPGPVNWVRVPGSQKAGTADERR